VGDFLGGGLFYWTGESLDIDNLLTFPAATGGTWVRVIESGQPFDIRWSGAYGNGINDDTDAMENAFNMMNDTITGDPPTSFPDLYGKIGNTISFPAGSYYIADGGGFVFQGKVVGHQFFNSNGSVLSSEFLIGTTYGPNVVFTCQEFRNLNIKTQGSGSARITIGVVNVSGCFFSAPITVYPLRNPTPPNFNSPTLVGSVTIQGCLLTDLYLSSLDGGDPPQVIINGSVFQGGIELAGADPTDLVINDSYYFDSSSSNYLPGIPAINTNGYSIAAMSPSTKPITLTSGTTTTNPARLLTGTIRIPVTLNPTSTAAATVSVAITDEYGNTTTTTMASAPAGSTAGIVQTITFDVPPQASYTVTATNATLEEGTISYHSTAISLGATSVFIS